MSSLERILGERRLVDVWRARIEGRLTGFIVGLSPAWALLHEVDGEARLDGFRAIRRSDVHRIAEVAEAKHFYARLVSELGWRPKRPRGVMLTDLRALLASVAATHPLLLVECELRHAGECWIGEPSKVGPRQLSLRTVDVAGRWDDTIRMSLADITTVAFRGSYLRALARLAH